MSWTILGGASTKTKTVTYTVTTLGSLLVAGFACADGTSTPTISDGVHTWTAVPASPIKDTTNAAGVSQWRTVAVATGAITITITAAPTTFNGTWVLEASGNHAAGAVDGSAGAANIAASITADAMKTGSFTPATDGCLIVSFLADDGNADTVTQYTAGTNFTKVAACSQDPAGAGETTYAVEYWIQPTAAAVNPSWTEAAAHVAVGIGAAFQGLVVISQPHGFVPQPLRPAIFTPGIAR